MSKVKKKRVGFVLDMTPLVDITFLLLTFFMFTAKFKSEADSEQKFKIVRPKSSADTTKLPETNLVMIKIGVDSVAKDTAYYVSMIKETDAENLAKAMVEAKFPDATSLTKSFKVKDTTWLYTAIRATANINPDAQYAIDADQGVKYRYIQDAMNQLRRNLRTRINFVTDKKTEQ